MTNFRIEPQHVGKKGLLITKTSGGNAAVENECMIGMHGMSYILLHNIRDLDGGGAQPASGFKYGLPINGNEISGRNISGIIIGFKLLSSDILWRKGAGGEALFRRVYKTDGILTYIGSVQKDIEDCKKPSATVQVADWEYLTLKGWEYYTIEISAEKKAAASVKKVINV